MTIGTKAQAMTFQETPNHIHDFVRIWFFLSKQTRIQEFRRLQIMHEREALEVQVLEIYIYGIQHLKKYFLYDSIRQAMVQVSKYKIIKKIMHSVTIDPRC